MASDIHNLIALPPGHRLDEYRIERYLGSGGFGITYSAIDEHLDRRVAIKEYLPKSLAMRDANNWVTVNRVEDEADFRWGLERFLDEARALACFDHPNIVGVKRFLEAHGTGYIVMEYVDGEPLSEMLKRESMLTEAEICEHVLPIAGGLAEIHVAGLLHRDIKPSNIMVRASGIPVLIDFGSARRAVNAKSRSLTAVVTDGYAPLEQYSSDAENQMQSTDIYALGAVLYCCVTGEKPEAATQRVSEDRLRPVVDVADGIYSDGLLTAIDAALAMESGERPRDIDEFRALLSPPTWRRVWPAIVGSRYEYGLGVEQDHAKALTWYTRAALLGDEEAEHYVAYAEGFQRDILAAEQGDAHAQYSLGQSYELGRCVQRDHALALKWFTRAAEQEHVAAQEKLGYLYANGEGVSQDHAQAAEWFTRAAEQGSDSAESCLEDLRIIRATELGDLHLL